MRLTMAKPQSEAAALGAVGALVVLLEDERQLTLRNPDAAVPDLYPDLVARTPAAEQNGPTVGVSYRVRQQVAQHHLEHVPVAADQQSRTHRAPAQPLFSSKIAEIRRKNVKHLVDREVALRGPEIPRFEAIHVEQARQNAGHGLERPFHALQEGASLPIPRCGSSVAASNFIVCKGCRRSWLAADRKLDFA